MCKRCLFVVLKRSDDDNNDKIEFSILFILNYNLHSKYKTSKLVTKILRPNDLRRSTLYIITSPGNCRHYCKLTTTTLETN